MYQYPLQCKRQRVRAQRGESLIGLNGYVPLNRVWFSTPEALRRVFEELPPPPARPRRGGERGGGEGDSRALIHVRNSASM